MRGNVAFLVTRFKKTNYVTHKRGDLVLGLRKCDWGYVSAVARGRNCEHLGALKEIRNEFDGASFCKKDSCWEKTAPWIYYYDLGIMLRNERGM